jgi:hypothetical protein
VGIEHRIAPGRVAVVVVVAAVTLAGIVGCGHSMSSRIGATLSSPAVAVTITRADVLARVQEGTGEVNKITRIEAKLTTLSKLATAMDNMSASGTSPYDGTVPAGRQIWMVAVAGTVTPAFDGRETFPWGVYIFDASTGDSLGMNAKQSGQWPPYFDGITDLAQS